MKQQTSSRLAWKLLLPVGNFSAPPMLVHKPNVKFSAVETHANLVSAPFRCRLKEKPKMFAKDAEITHALVLKKLVEIVAARGKKGTDRQEQVALLSELRTISDAKGLGPAIKAKVDFAIISALFDYNPAVIASMREDQWEKFVSNF